MSFLERMRALAVEKAKQAEEILAKPFVDSEVAASRRAICEECPSLKKPLNQCDICKCFMDVKTKFNGTRCPVGKW
jgi:hypothetical protein